MILAAYTGGSGLKAVARMQNGMLKKYLWDATMISCILQDECYTGTLI